MVCGDAQEVSSGLCHPQRREKVFRDEDDHNNTGATGCPRLLMAVAWHVLTIARPKRTY
jgi:hypothetical protein